MTGKHPDILAQNPLRLMKHGFATYTEEDTQHVIAIGKKPKFDVERDRRLETEEEQRILKILDATPDERVIFILALETAMRMRECYTLSKDQISLAKKTIHLDRSKKWRHPAGAAFKHSNSVVGRLLAESCKSDQGQGRTAIPILEWQSRRA